MKAIYEAAIKAVSYFCNETKTQRVSAYCLREMGFNFTESIPDIASVSVHSILIDYDTDTEGSSITFNLGLNFTEPFEWIEMKLTVPKQED